MTGLGDASKKRVDLYFLKDDMVFVNKCMEYFIQYKLPCHLKSTLALKVFPSLYKNIILRKKI